MRRPGEEPHPAILGPMAAMPLRVILLFPFPTQGSVKPGLASMLGARGAAALHRELAAHTLREARAFAAASGTTLEARVFGAPDETAARVWLGGGVTVRAPGDGDLGVRLERAFADAFAEGASSVLAIVSACPGFAASHLATACAQLAGHDAVVGPAIDGSFYLVGMRRHLPALFRNVRWNEREVLAQMLSVARTLRMTVARLAPLHNLGTPADLAAWAAAPVARADGRDGVSVVISAGGDEPRLEATLAAAAAGAPHDIVVVAPAVGRTAEVAWAHGARVVPPPTGAMDPRNRGAAYTAGEHLLFLPAASVPPGNCAALVRAVLARPGVAGGTFALTFEEEFRGRRWIERSVNWRARRQLPCHEQGLFVRREIYEHIGGFTAHAPDEDFAFLRRLRRFGTIAVVAGAAKVRADRWRRLGPLRTSLLNRLVAAGDRLCVAPTRLARWHGAT